MRVHYEIDDKAFPEDAYSVGWHGGCDGIAWYVLGWETEPDIDTEWSGIMNRTGLIVCVMVGDNKHFLFDIDDISPFEREAYCGECGQIGCSHDGYDRS